MKDGSIKRLNLVSDRAWAEATRTLNVELRIITADQAARDALPSGATIRRVIGAMEQAVVAGTAPGRAYAGKSRSAAVRAQLAVRETWGAAAIRKQAEDHIRAVGLDPAPGGTLMNEAIARAQAQPDPDPLMPNPWPGRLRRAAAYVGDKIVVVILAAVAGGIITAVVLTALKLD